MSPKEEKQKISAWVPQGLVRELDILIRNSKDPTLQTMTDGYNYCLELGVKKLAEAQDSEEGAYIADLFTRLRRKELDDKVEDAEKILRGYEPKNYSQRPGNVRALREEG